MIEFNFAELNLLNKLLSKVKYSELDLIELNNFANSPITNSIMEKIQMEFKPIAEKINESNNGVQKFQYQMENHIGIAISKRLIAMDSNSLQAISN
jgi:hypothetical protein